MEVLWTTYPPAATKLNVRSSRWVRPMSKGTEAWTLLGMEIIDILYSVNNVTSKYQV